MGLFVREFATRFGVDVDILHRWECSNVPASDLIGSMKTGYDAILQYLKHI